MVKYLPKVTQLEGYSGVKQRTLGLFSPSLNQCRKKGEKRKEGPRGGGTLHPDLGDQGHPLLSVYAPLSPLGDKSHLHGIHSTSLS